MKVLLTGAFGNVGTSTLEELLKQGHTVRCFDVRTPANVATARRYRGRVDVVWGDLRNPDDVAQAVAGQDAVLHVAFIIPKMSVTGIESEQHPEWAEAVNVGGTRNLVRALQQQPHPPSLIFTSSLHIYGRTQHLAPPRTTADIPQPIEHYAKHKMICEKMIRESGLQWAILRLAATLPLALKLDPGMFDVPLNNRIEYVHTRDVGLALANAISSDAIWGKTLHIGGGAGCQFSYGQMVGRILEAMGVGMLPDKAFTTVPFPTDWLDTTESQALLCFQTRDLDNYVRDLIQLLGLRAHLIRLMRPLVRLHLLHRSPHWGQRPEWRQRSPEASRVALVTGASSGIGAATARQLARQGLKVVLVARRAERLELVADEIRRDGGTAWVIAADLADEGQRLRVLQEARTLAGHVDVLVNGAGIGWYGYGSEMPWPLAWKMIQTNLIASAHLSLLMLQEMKARGGGHIINIGSIAGGLPEQGIALYSATKSFLDSFTTALYRERADSRVSVSVVRPGPVKTEFYQRALALPGGGEIPGQRFAVNPEAVARRVAALVKRPKRVAYVPAWLGVVQWVEPVFGWLIDRLGPMLLRRQHPRPLVLGGGSG